MSSIDTNKAGHDLIGGLVSYEHGDCSIAASFLNKDVYDLVQSKRSRTRTRTVPLIESPEEILAQPVRIFDVPGLNPSDGYEEKIEIDGLNPIKLVFVEQTPLHKQRLGFVPKLPPRKSRAQERPLLAALFENSFLLPLASFKRTEEDGVCSFVQIGNEPRDESVHGTGSDDDRTPSLALVECMRHIMEHHLNSHGNDPAPLIELIYEQMARHSKQMSRLFERTLASRLHERLIKTMRRRDFVFADSTHEDNDLMSSVTYNQLVPEYVTKDGGRVGFMTASLLEREEFWLCAITRGNVAVPVAVIDRRDGSLKQVPLEGQALPDKDQFIQTLLIALAQGTPDRRLTAAKTDQRLNGDLSKVNDPDVRQAFRAHLIDPDIYPLPEQKDCDKITDSNYNSLVDTIDYRIKRNSETATLFHNLGVEAHLTALRGETSPHYEYMLARLDAVIGPNTKTHTIQGVVKKVLTGKTTVDHELVIELTRTGSCIEVKIGSRSTSMTEKPLAFAPTKSFDLTGPMPQQHEAEAIIGLLDSLKSADAKQ